MKNTSSILFLSFLSAVVASQTVTASAQRRTARVGPSNEDPNWEKGWTNIVPPNRTGQTFIAKSRTVSSIDVALLTTGNKVAGKDTIILKILSKNGRVLVKTSKTVSVGFDGWLRFKLPGRGLKVTPGAKLTIILEDTGKVAFGWKWSLDKYPSGTAIVLGKEDTRFDFLFRVNH